MADKWMRDMKDCPRFCPTEEEFLHPLLYLEAVRKKCEAEGAGICVIHPPVAATEPASLVLKAKYFRFSTRVIPLKQACWETRDALHFYDGTEAVSLLEFESKARRVALKVLGSNGALPPQEVERRYWEELASGNEMEVEYGSDLDGSAFSNSPQDPLGSSDWNLNKLPRLGQSMLRHEPGSIPGVTDPMLYVGMLFSTFAWHVEDHNLYSINFHHLGAAKTWYGVGPHHAAAFEKVVRERVFSAPGQPPISDAALHSLLIGKAAMFSPGLLMAGGVDVVRAVQQPGDFVLTFPRAYHTGFSHGFNCGEAVNFATADWLQEGASALLRYSDLARAPIIAHDAYLCKEMEVVMGRVGGGQQGAVTKAAFVVWHDRAEKRMEEMKAERGGGVEVRTLRHRQVVECSLCRTHCHVAMLTCDCEGVGPTCLFHDRRLPECACEKVDVSLHCEWPQWKKWALQAREEEGVRRILEHMVPVASYRPATPPKRTGGQTPPIVGSQGEAEARRGGGKRVKVEG